MLGRCITTITSALTTRKGAMAGAVALMAVGAIAALGSSPAVSTGATLKLAQADGAAQPAAKAGDPGLFSAEEKQAIERIIKDYLVQNPEVLLEVGKALEQRQAEMQTAEQKRLIVEHRDEIFASPTDFVMGNPNGDITVVEFFDYNCPYCKRALAEITELVKADSNVKVILKEFPILSESSLTAAKAAMAALEQGKYMELHTALMEARQISNDSVFKIAEKVGLDVERLKSDMKSPQIDAAIKQTSDIARALGINGTPVFIVDTKVNVGLLPQDELVQLVSEARKEGCQIC